MLPRLQQQVPPQLAKPAFRHSKSYTVYRTKALQNATFSKTGTLPVRRARLGSQEVTQSRRLAVGTPQRPNNFGRSSREMHSRGSQELIASKLRISNSCNFRRRPQLRKTATLDKPWNPDTHIAKESHPARLLSAHKPRRPKQLPAVADSYRLVMDPDYRHYKLLQNRRYPQHQPFDLEKMFRRSYRSLQNFMGMVCFSNKVQFEKRKKRQYCAFVDKGNNSVLVKHLLTTRFWWTIADDKQELDSSAVQLHWCQKRKMDSINLVAPLRGKAEGMTTEGRGPELAEARKEKKVQRPLAHYQLMLSESDAQAVAQHQLLHRTQVKWKELQTHRGSEQRIKPVEFTHNHLEFGQELGDKKQLFHNVKQHLQNAGSDPFEVMPLTFHFTSATDPSFQEFVSTYKDAASTQPCVWIVKPGQNTNRGNGIEVMSSLDEISQHMTATKLRMPDRTFIVQKYISPFLFFRRKFDIRCYLLITSHAGTIKAYFYKDGYLRTSCKQFSMKRLANKYVHLTNDAVQKKSEEYGRFEKGNKVSYSEFQRYLNLIHPSRKLNFEERVLPIMKEYARLAVQASWSKLDANCRGYTFELFGLDYLLDDNLKPWLIEVNSNPCLELSSPLLAVLIPSMLENTFRIAVDPVFPPPEAAEWPNCQKASCPSNYLEANRYELIFEGEPPKERDTTSAVRTINHARLPSYGDDVSANFGSARKEP